MKSSILAIVLMSLFLGACSKLEEPTIPWYLAVVRGDIEQVERHIHWNTDVNAPFPSGRYPLHEAAEKGRVILLKLLLENGADIEVTDSAQRTPLELAILAGRTQAASLLIKAKAELDPSKVLLLAAKQDVEDRDVIRFLKSQGADFETVDDEGNTPLLIAVKRNNHRLAHHLAEQGANVNAANKQGKTALRLAEEVGAIELIRFLERNGGVRSAPTPQ